MAFWQRNHVIIAIASVIAGAVYFGVVVQQSLAVSEIIAPQAMLVFGYIIIQVGLSAIGIIAWEYLGRGRNEYDDSNLPADGMDERDRRVKTKSDADASQFYYLFTFVALLGWFAHENAFLLFHSFIAVFVIGDLVRCGFQILYYNRAI